jgi:glyoxylase I family protein
MIPNDITEKFYIDHLVLTIKDLGRTTDFYSRLFGKPAYSNAESIMYHVGSTKLFFTLPHNEPPPDDQFNASRIGLEHFAIGVTTIADLRRIEEVLNSQGIRHSGIHIDRHSKMEKIWLDDPDKIRVEFFIPPARR